MQVIVNGDPHIDGRQAMSDLLESVDALGHCGERVARIEAHLTDTNAASNGRLNGIHCMLEARTVGLEPVIVKDRGETAHQAVQGALRKMELALASTFKKHDPRYAARTVRPAGRFDGGASSAPSEPQSRPRSSSGASRPLEKNGC